MSKEVQAFIYGTVFGFSLAVVIFALIGIYLNV